MISRNPLPALSVALGIGLAISSPLSQAALLGLAPILPTIDFPGSGIIDYDAATSTVTISGNPVSVFSATPFFQGEILGTGSADVKDLTIQFKVDGSGNFVSGVTGNDLTVTGWIDANGNGVNDAGDHDGVLLTAEATQFGFMDGAPGAPDAFDLRLNAVGGALAFLYAGQDLAVQIISEPSTGYPMPFSGSFNASWTGQAKGVIGAEIFVPIPPAFWLWGGALGATAPLIRKVTRTSSAGAAS